MNIVLIGFRGTGKTTIGKKLAARLGWEFADSDDLIEERGKRSIREIFEKEGEPYFRKVEKETIAELAKRDSLVIAAGGGAVLDADNVRNLKQNGKLVLLTADAGTIHRRISGAKRSKLQRPALTSLDERPEIEHLLAKRKPYYESAADLIVESDSNSVSKVVEEILGYVRRLGKG